MNKLEILLEVDKYQSSDDPNFQFLPIQPPLYLEEYVEKLEKQALFKDSLNEQIPTLKKNRMEKKMRKQAHLQMLTKGWFGMKQQDQDEEAKNNYLIMKLKKYLDPKQTFKSSEFKTIPKYFQVGTYVNGGDNFGLKQKLRKTNKKTIVEQFLELDDSKQVSRKKFQELQQKTLKVGRINSKLKRLRAMSKRIGKKR